MSVLDNPKVFAGRPDDDRLTDDERAQCAKLAADLVRLSNALRAIRTVADTRRVEGLIDKVFG